MKKIHIVAFDLDGVLVDDWFHDEALQHALKDIGKRDLFEIHVRPLRGLPTRVKMEMLCTQGHLQKDECTIVADLKQKYTEDYIENMQFDQDIYDIMSDLIDDGKIIAVVSNARQRTVDAILTKMGVRGMVTNVITPESLPELKPKPYPDMYNYLAKLHLCPPENILVLEDSERGRQAAVSAGCELLPIKGSSDLRDLPNIVMNKISHTEERVALVIATYNAKEYVERAVYSLQRTDPGRQVDLYIVDNGSTSEHTEVSKAMLHWYQPGEENLIYNTEGGFDTNAYRIAFLKIPYHPYYLFSQDDVEFRDGWAEKMIGKMTLDRFNSGVVALSTFPKIFDNNEQERYVEELIGKKPLPNVPSIFGPIFMASHNAMLSAFYHKAWKVPVESKLHQQGWERGWGQLFADMDIPVESMLTGYMALLPGTHDHSPIQHLMASFKLGDVR